MIEQTTKQKVEALFTSRRQWEALWDTVYNYVAPERATLFQGKQSPQEIQSQVFDSTAIDAAERLTNLLISGLIPPWQKWFYMMPGLEVREQDQRAQLRPLFQEAEDLVYEQLNQGGFYPEMQGVLLDRIVGGTCCLSVTPREDKVLFKVVPLAEVAIGEDAYGRVSQTARKTKWTTRSLMHVYEERLPDHFKQSYGAKDAEEHDVVELVEREVDGQYSWTLALCYSGGPGETILESGTFPLPRLLVSRWTKIPGEAYGRSPALRTLADIRALNKIKELSLKNAALAVSGVYTVVNDGVVNAYTLTIEPGARIPVLSNNPNDRSIDTLPLSTDFNVAMFSMDELRNSIKQAFMADQFQPLGRTPATATEIAERTRVIAHDMGATLARLQGEMLVPALQWCLWNLRRMEAIPPALEVDGKIAEFRFVSRLSQAQWAEEKANILSLAGIAAQFGEFDPQAGLVVDTQAALRRIAELDALPDAVMRSAEEVEELTRQAAQVTQQLRTQGDPPA